jgi:hypothetical protein
VAAAGCGGTIWVGVGARGGERATSLQEREAELEEAPSDPCQRLLRRWWRSPLLPSEEGMAPAGLGGWRAGEVTGRGSSAAAGLEVGGWG